MRIVLREVKHDDATGLLGTEPKEEDQPVSAHALTDEKSQLEDYGTHHQKPILIDYDYDNGSKAIGYVMGLNSVTDYWDRTAHEVDDPKTRGSVGQADRGRDGPRAFNAAGPEQRTASPPGCTRGRQVCFRSRTSSTGKVTNTMCMVAPFRTTHAGSRGQRLHSCTTTSRTAGPKRSAIQGRSSFRRSLRRRFRRVAGSPAHLVQIVRTQPEEREKSIKELYFQATSSARNYIYIENQYFFYPEFARNLIKTRQKHCSDWMSTSHKPVTEMPKLHLFIVIPHPERAEMVPRTYDSLSLLGASTAMAEQGDLASKGELDSVYGKTTRRPWTGT
ncbi:hypothetical protein DX980_01000 (plasmid) [Burkholderia gladioli]|nr:hypothetical protein DX980_01000 [Burkholderia gladioli]